MDCSGCADRMFCLCERLCKLSCDNSYSVSRGLPNVPWCEGGAPFNASISSK